MKLLITYFSALTVLLVLDSIWLFLIAKNFYKKYIGHLYAENVNFASAILFYLIYTLGIVVFCVMPNADSNSPLKTLLLGGLFGLVAYATYDLTNLATLKGFPVNVAVVDIIWGAVVTSLVSLSAYYVFKFFN